MNDLRVSIVGSGNVAFHLATAFSNAGIRIHEICGRNLKDVRRLASLVKAGACSDPSKLSPATDVVIIAVNDDTIASVAKKIKLNEQIVLHTAGSVPMNVLEKFSQHGVLWPLQTFSKDRKVIMQDVPICVEGSDRSTLYSISNIASAVSDFVYELDSKQRAYAHLAAVFANNFSNHMYTLADDILKEHNLPFDLIRPLILESALKVLDHSPAASQTGPAKRGDRKTIEKQVKMLQPARQKLYKQLSESISKKGRSHK